MGSWLERLRAVLRRAGNRTSGARLSRKSQAAPKPDVGPMTDRAQELWATQIGPGPDHAPPLHELRERLRKFDFPDTKIDEAAVSIGVLIDLHFNLRKIAQCEPGLPEISKILSDLALHLRDAVTLIDQLPIDHQEELVLSLPINHPFHPGYSKTTSGLKIRTIRSRDPETGLLGGETGTALAGVRDLLSALASHATVRAERVEAARRRRRRPRRDALLVAAIEALGRVWATAFGLSAFARGRLQQFEKFLLVFLAKPPWSIAEPTVLGAAKAYLKTIKPQRELAATLASWIDNQPVTALDEGRRTTAAAKIIRKKSPRTRP